MQAINREDFLSRNFEHIVFSGGGNRCWWQAGMVEVLSQLPCWNARQLFGASAGAGIATAFATGKIHNSLHAAITRFDATPRNVEWRDLLKGKRPFMLPRIYPEWITTFLEAPDLARLRSLNLRVQVAITRPIPLLPLSLSTLVALTLYATEKYWMKTFHSRLPHKVGLRAEYHDIGESLHIDDARSLLLASGAAVPITPIHRVNGRPALDGGFYDNQPLPQDRNADASTLVLLTRHNPAQPTMFEYDKRVYLQPTSPVAAINMDCTSGDNVRKTYEQGRREAESLAGRT
jgi:predicted acylesterase/phospholipase RssA